jgi:glycosyltransferase involved in cell wall biosynthesis
MHSTLENQEVKAFLARSLSTSGANSCIEGPQIVTVALFHPAFETIGGAEILVATQAKCIARAGVDVRVVTLSFDQTRWAGWFDGIPVRVTPKLPWLDRLAPELTRLQRTIPRANEYLTGCHTVVACNFPTNVLLGASSIKARRIWSCTEPSRYLHLAATNPRLDGRHKENPSGITESERYYTEQLERNERDMRKPARAGLVAFDIEQTKKLDSIYAISECSRDSVRRVYGRSDAKVIYPVVRFPAERMAHRAGLDRSGLQILTHSRLETLKNVDSVLRGFALFLAKHPSSRLHVVGEGSQRGRLDELARQLGIAASIRFHDYLAEAKLREVYAACDVFALLPLDEPFGMVFPEAAARGLLLVGPDHGGPFEILDGGRIGWVGDPFQAESIAEAFARIWSLSDHEVDQRRSIADEACRSRFSESVIGPQLVSAFAAEA